MVALRVRISVCVRDPRPVDWSEGVRGRSAAAEEVAKLDVAGADDARRLGSSLPVSILLVAPVEALNVLFAAALGGGKMLARS